MMVFAFRSVLAALPLVTAVVAAGIGIVVVGLIGHSLEVSSAAPMLASMLGLGVGIDYALFFVTRLRGSWHGQPLRRHRARGRAFRGAPFSSPG